MEEFPTLAIGDGGQFALQWYLTLEDFPMPEIGPTAVTLKINRTSVMLYACHYVRLPEGVGATVQTYLGSFPVTATEVPPKFAALLREATLGRPERHQALMRRINDAVLEPARARRERAEAARQRVAIGQALDWATLALRELPTMANYAKVILTPNAQAALAGLLAATERLAADAAGRQAHPYWQTPWQPSPRLPW